MHEEVPYRKVAHLDATRCKFRPDRPQRQVGLLGQARQKPLSLTRQRIGPPAAHLVGRRTPGRTEPLRPLHNAGNADLEGRCHRAAALTRTNCSNHPLAQIKGISSGHQMLASIPASILNHIQHQSGILRVL